MDYGIYSRPKLSRNKWSVVVGGDMSSNTFYSSANSLFGGSGDGSNTPVGGDMSSLSDFIGATDIEDGKRGIVPAPLAGQEQMFLQGSGAWIDIPAYRWLYEWPKSEGLEKTGLGIDGDFYVQRNLTTYNLEVEGSAHFWELVIDKVKANGGQIIVSPSLFYIDHIGRIQSYYLSRGETVYSVGGLKYPFGDLKQVRTDIWHFLEMNDVVMIRARRVYMRNDDSTKRIENECDLFDMMRCRTFNVQAGVYHDVSNKDYWSFVLGLGEETYIDDKNNVQEAMYIDLAYSMKTSDGRYIPFGSTLYPTGWIVPQGWTPQQDIYELKRISRMMYDGTEIVDEEYPEEDEMNEITTYVLLIRGLEDSIQYLLGNPSTNRIINDEDLIHTKAMIDFTSRGILPSDVNDLAQLILTNEFSETYGVDYVIEETNLQLDASRQILGETSITKGPTSEEEGEENAEESERKLDASWYYEHDYTSDEYTVKWQFCHGIFKPGEDDSLACLGNLLYVDRMNAIVISASTPIDPEIVPPAICQYHLIDMFGETISKFRMTTIAKNGNEFFGNFLINNNGRFVNINENIELYIKDLNTQLELVGIHLDGDNSTIKMVGNIELHQHADGNDDTLSIFDSQERKRLEMIPRDIPQRGSEESTITTGSNKYFNSDNPWTGTSAYITVEEHKEGGILWHWIGGHKEYDYMLYKNSNDAQFRIDCSATIDLGYIPAGKIIDISYVSFTVDTTRTYLCGKDYQDMLRLVPLYPDWGTHGGNPTITLKRGNVVERTLASSAQHIVPCTITNNGKTYSYNDTFTLLNDYAVVGGNYTIQIDVSVYPIALVASTRDNYPKPYFNGTAKLSGYIYTSVNDERESDTSDMSLSKMVIGTNGMVFNASNSRYFYAGTDGYEFKWDSYSLSIDNENGVRLVQGSEHIGKRPDDANPYTWNDMIHRSSRVCLARHNGTISLPRATPYWNEPGFGNGREITVIGQQGLTILGPIMFYSPGLSINGIEIIPGGWLNASAFKLGLQFSKITDSVSDYYIVPTVNCVITFICVNEQYYVTGGLDWALAYSNN